MSVFTVVEQEQLRNGAMIALGMVTEAEPVGLVDLWRQNRAGAKVLDELPEPLHEAVLGDYSTPDDYEFPLDETLESYLGIAMLAIERRAPELADSYRHTLVRALEACASAVGGVSVSEAALIERVRHALGLAVHQMSS